MASRSQPEEALVTPSESDEGGKPAAPTTEQSLPNFGHGYHTARAGSIAAAAGGTESTSTGALEDAASQYDDGLKTPTSTGPPVVDAFSALASSNTLQPVPALPKAHEPTSSRNTERKDYFTADNITPTTSRPQALAAVLPSTLQSAIVTSPSSAPATAKSDMSADERQSSSSGPEHTEGPEATTATSTISRGTSSPVAPFIPLVRNRELDDHHLQHSQASRALQNSQQPQPVRPVTSSPRSNPHYQYPTSNASSSSDLAQIPQTSKTAGNTPVQSPNLLSPTFTSKKPALEVEEGHYTTSMANPPHLQTTKETHKLLKDIDPISGRKLVNNYELYYKLGSGQHGTVKLGRNLDTGEKVAVKIVRRFSKKLRLGRTRDPNDMIKREVAILKKARHPHIVSLFEVIDDEEFAKVYLILEYVEKGEIVWRKPTEKPLAMFEKGRLEREMSGGYDEVAFRHAVEIFNNEVPSRREERERLREEARVAHQNLQSPHSRRKQSIADPFAGAEYGGESETESVSESAQGYSHYDADARWSRADFHAAETAKQSPQNATPSHTPRSCPQPSAVEHFTSSQPNSRPESPNYVDSSYIAPLSDDGKESDLDLHSMLDRIIANRTHWTEDEEYYRYVPCLTLNQARDAFRDTVLGLEFLHYQGIMHRDIKPANLLWTHDYRVKISDFGVSYLGKPMREDNHKDEISDVDEATLDEDIELAKTVGTPAFYAPELCDPDFFDTDKYTQRPAITGQIDVWALGVTLYAMIYGRLPFYDSNEFKMYEKIARDDVFIPCMRLKGVEHTDGTPSNHNKRLDDVLEYEEVDDTLRDLVKRLLSKKPSQRITLKEVIHHPWVINGIDDMDAWLDQTDPSSLSKGEKIKPSEEEIKDAVVGVLPMFDRFKTNVQTNLQRLGSVFRGRGSRKRTDSNPKVPESATSASSSRAKEDRRSSLRGDEQIFSALRASREASEHPLAHSVAASPEARPSSQYFSEKISTLSGGAMASFGSHNPPPPPPPDPALSTADSVKTIRPHSSSYVRDLRPTSSVSEPFDDFSSTTPVLDPQSAATSGISNILGATGRFMSNIRSRERGPSRSSPSQSSRSSSVDNREELHANPSLAVSSAVAAGHVDQPPVLREDIEVQPPRSTESSAETFQRAQEQNWRRQIAEHARPRIHRRSVSLQAAEVPCPPSPDDDIFYGHARPASAAESSLGFPAISSSSDMIVSGDSAVHSRIPSIVSGASSLSVPPEGEEIDSAPDPFKNSVPHVSGDSHQLTHTPPTSNTLKISAGDEAGYTGEAEDSDSEDEGLAMA